MEKLSRRKFIEKSLKGGGLLLLLGVGSCSDKITGIINSEVLDNVDNDLASQIFYNYCIDNYNGYYLRHNSRLLKKAASFNESAYGISARDKVVVIDDFKVLSSTAKGNVYFFNTRYKYYGVIKGETFYKYSPKNKMDAYLNFKIKVINNNGNLYVSSKVPSFCQKDIVKQHILNLIKNTHNPKNNYNRLKNLNAIINLLS